jgi:4-amino-4-deoxy-L-arabinose transferase-like glycosyltransferase
VNADMKKTFVLIMLLVIFGCGLFFLNMRGWNLWKPDEPRWAQTGKNMYDGEDWIIPHLNGEVDPSKPPMLFWLIALSGKLLGTMDEQAARLPSAFFGVLTLLIVFSLAKKLFDEKTGFFSALILATSGEFYWFSRRVAMDIPMTFFITLSIFLFYSGYQRKERRILFYSLAYVAMALGGLLKTYPGWFIPALVVGVYFLIKKEKKFFIDPAHLWGVSLFVLIVGGWLSLAYLEGGKYYVAHLLIDETAALAYKTSRYGHSFLFLFSTFLLEFLPWTFFLPSAIFFYVKEKERRGNFFFLLCWAFAVFCLFSVGMMKRDLYLLPLYPATAVMVGYFWKEVIEQAGKSKLLSVPLFSLFTILFIIGLASPFIITKLGTRYLSRPLEVGLICSVILCLGSLFGSLAYFLKRKSLSFYIIVLILFSIASYTVLRILPDVNKFVSSRPFSQQVVKIIGQDGKLATYRCFESYFNFYTGKNRILEIKNEEELKHFLNSQEKVYCIIRKEEWQGLHNKKKSWATYLNVEGCIGDKKFVIISNERAKE